MNKFITNTLFLLSLSVSVCADNFVYDPSRLSSAESTYSKVGEPYDGEKYRDIFYEKIIVFRVLERLMPVFDSFILEARRRHTNIYYSNIGDGFFLDANVIRKSFFVPQYPESNIVVNHEQIILTKKNNLIIDDYYLQINLKDNVQYKIDENLFSKLKILKTEAEIKDQLINIDLRLLNGFKTQDLHKILYLVEKKSFSDDLACEKCFEAKKSMLFVPCNHVLACEDCGDKLIECSRCGETIESKQKINW